MSKGRTVLITGTSGYVGSELARHLGRSGFRVIGTHRAGRSPVRVEGIQTSMPLDLLAAQPLSAGALAGVDAVVHAAGVAHGKDPGNLYTANADGALALGRQAAQAGVGSLVFLSTIGVHGLGDGGAPITEETPIRPANVYASAKRDAEVGLQAITAGTGTALTVLRPPMVYGPGAPGNLQTLLHWSARGLPFPKATLDNRRNFVAIDTLIEAIEAAIRRPPNGQAIYVVADIQEVATGWVFKRLSQEMGRKPRFVPLPTKLLRIGLRAVGRERIYQGLFADLRINATKLHRDLNVALTGDLGASVPNIVRRFRQGKGPPTDL